MHLLNFLADSHPPIFYVMMIPIAAIAFAAVFLFVSLHFRNLEDQRMHETARLALEKGQPVPSFARPDGRYPRYGPGHWSWIGLLIGGLVNVALGIGLFVMLTSIPGAYVARYCSLIPALIGVALLLAALIVGMTSRAHSDPGGRPPMS
jgi:hypothetical protein